jgi:hypothetical protein
VFAQLGFEQANQLAHLLIDGAYAAEVIVMFGDFEHAVARHVPPAQDILKEGDDIGGLLRPAKRN